MLLVFALGLAGLFYFLGKSADLIIFNIRIIAERLGAPIFLVGIILGVFTSLPEITIGINAVARNVEEVSFGNLMGGTVVLFSLLLGLSIVLNRSISTIGDLRHLPILSVYVLLPLLFGFDDVITWGEGMVMVVSYLAVLSWLYWSYRRSRLSTLTREISVGRKPMTYNIFMLTIGCVLVSICAALIMRITVEMLSMFEISPFVLGLIVFSLGTNLPELIVTVRSWQRKSKELSISNLIGSAVTNVLTIGSFALIAPMHTGVGSAYYILVAFLVVLIIIIAIFHRTRREFSEQEGVALIALYALFIMMQFYAVRYL